MLCYSLVLASITICASLLPTNSKVYVDSSGMQDLVLIVGCSMYVVALHDGQFSRNLSLKIAKLRTENAGMAAIPRTSISFTNGKIILFPSYLTDR